MQFLPFTKTIEIWRKITTGSVNRQIFGAAMTVAAFTTFVKFATVAKELYVAWKFGTGDDIDAFIIAFVVPSFIVNVIAGSFNSALIPTYIEVRETQGKKTAQQLFSGVTFWGILLLIITTTLMLTTAQVYLPWIAPGFSNQKLELTFDLLYAMTPIILLSGIIIIWGAILNAGERFALAAITPIFAPIITIVFILWIDSWGTFNLIAGLMFGAFAEAIALGIVLKRQGFDLIPKWYRFNPHLRQVINQYIPMLAGSFLICSTGIIDQSMAAMLPSGSVAALNYGNRVIALPITLASTALSTAVTPYFSKMVSLQNWRQVNQTLKKYICLICLITIPATGILISFSQLIVQILFQRGSFSVDDTHLVGQIQSCFALQIPFYIGSILLVRLISAIRYNHILMYGAVISLICNIAFNYLFMQTMGVVGIALSTSCVYAISFFFLLYFWWHFLRRQKT